MKRGRWLSTFIVLFCLAFAILPNINALNQSSDNMQAEVDILAETVSIEVPEHIDLGNATKGYDADYARVDLNNTGTTNIIITPELQDSNEKIFSYLYFARRTTEDFLKIGDFSMNITKPTSAGGKRSDYCYIKLDLTNYPEEIPTNIMDHKANIIFWAMPY